MGSWPDVMCFENVLCNISLLFIKSCERKSWHCCIGSLLVQRWYVDATFHTTTSMGPTNVSMSLYTIKSRASDFFQDWWAEVTHGAKNGGSFSEMMGQSISN